MEKHALGSTGENLSVIGFGGILVMNETAETSRRLVSQAIERGINYFDVAPRYGNAEQMLGPALEPYRMVANTIAPTCSPWEGWDRGGEREGASEP